MVFKLGALRVVASFAGAERVSIETSAACGKAALDCKSRACHCRCSAIGPQVAERDWTRTERQRCFDLSGRAVECLHCAEGAELAPQGSKPIHLLDSKGIRFTPSADH